jgi:RecA-superfamily ATPases implicated in signal transduction
MIVFDKFTLVYGMFNQSIFPEAKMNMDKLKEYFSYDAFSTSNSLITKLLRLIEIHKYEEITEGAIRLELAADRKTSQEIEEIVKKINEYKSYESSQIGEFRAGMRKICYSGYINKIKTLHDSDPVGFVESCKKFEYLSNYSDKLQVKEMSTLDVTDLSNLYLGKSYKSTFEFINNSYANGGYVPGQIVAVTASPGTGKSLFLQCEALNFIRQGLKVHYLALGDMNELDFVIRMTSQLIKRPMDEVSKAPNLIPLFESVRDYFKNRFYLTVVPSGSISVDEYVDYIKSRINDFDVLQIDYDANFQNSLANSSYDHYGKVYDKLTELSRAQKLVMVAGQTRKEYWKEEYLPLEALSESVRKQQIVDMVIGIGRNKHSRLRMGKFTIPKNRRGSEGRVQEWIGTSEGLFYPCSTILYSKYKEADRSLRRIVTYDSLVDEDVILD